MTKKTLLITALIGLILVGGAGFGYYTMKMNANSFKGRAIPTQGVDDEVSKKWEKAFQDVLADEELLQVIVNESEYAAKLKVSEGEAVSHLKDAIKVRFVKRKNSIEVGLLGKRKQNEDLIAISTILYGRAQEAVEKNEPSFAEYMNLIRQHAKKMAPEEP